MMYKHWSDFDAFTEWEWPNFTPEELSCKCCGEYYHDPESLDRLQKARQLANRPFIITSAHRCTAHNLASGGAKASQHLQIAFDISLTGHPRRHLLQCLFEAGFTTFGMYNSFIHTDKRPWRRWYGAGGVIKKEWQRIYAKVVKGE